MFGSCSTQGGRGNKGGFIERGPKNLRAAGVLSRQESLGMKDCMQQHSLQDATDALLRAAVLPPATPPPRAPPLRRPPPRDTRHAGPRTNVNFLINPPIKHKFQMVVDDLKETVYASYWEKPIGRRPDRTSHLPNGFDYNKRLGTKTVLSESVANLISPAVPLDLVPKSTLPSLQTQRNYRKPPFKPTQIFGYKSNQDRNGSLVKCCIHNDSSNSSSKLATPISAIQSDFKRTHEPKTGFVLETTQKNLSLPEELRFGVHRPKLTETTGTCLTFSNINYDKLLLMKCLGHLNNVRTLISKFNHRNHHHQSLFYRHFYYRLKYLDKCGSGWIPKELVYKSSHTHNIWFNQTLLEPLMAHWGIFDGTHIKYDVFVDLLNSTQPLPELPVIKESEDLILEYGTTYGDMIKSGQEKDDRHRAGIPSGWYLDKDYPSARNHPKRSSADGFHLPEESDVRCNLFPSVASMFGVSHRNMYAVRDRQTVRKVFGAVEEFTDEKFDAIWNEAVKYHSQGLVCYETFRRAMNNLGLSKFS